MHKIANVLNKLPKSQQPKAKRSLREIWMAETRKEAEKAFDAFIAAYMLKFEKAAAVPGERTGRCLLVILRLPCRALEALAHLEPDRVAHVRLRAPPHHPDQGPL